MDDDIDQIIADIEKRALETTDLEPMELFVERGRLSKRWQAWKTGSVVVAILAGIISFFAFFTDSDYGVVEAGGVAVVVMGLAGVLVRHYFESRTRDWLARARQVVGR